MVTAPAGHVGRAARSPGWPPTGRDNGVTGGNSIPESDAVAVNERGGQPLERQPAQPDGGPSRQNPATPGLSETALAGVYEGDGDRAALRTRDRG